MTASLPRLRRAALLAFLGCMLLPITALGASSPNLADSGTATATAHQVALGVYLPGVPRDMWKVKRYARKTGRRPAIISYWQEWGGAWPRFDATANSRIRALGATPLISWDPWRGRVEDPRYALRTIIGGRHDRYIRRWARAAAQWGHTVYVRFASEMNGHWSPWSRWHNGNKPRHYIRAWRHVVKLFRDRGATNVKWVWAPNEVGPDSTPLARLYPGNSWVDWVGFSGYNFGNSWGWAEWRSMIGLYRPTVRALRAIAPGKPILVAETGSTWQGGNKARWIREGFRQLPVKLPQIRAVVWFNYRMKTAPRRYADWRVEQTRTTLSAYRRVVKQWRYHGKL
jgi:hypothetical protein